MAKKKEIEPTNKFDQLMMDLINGELNHNHIQIAYRAAIRHSKHLPDGIKDILGGKADNQAGILADAFSLIKEISGNMELAYRRGYTDGQIDAEEERKKKQKKQKKKAKKKKEAGNE